MPASPRRRPYDETLGIYSIGPKLKTLRLEKGPTLSRLGVETKLSTALLSKLESSLMIPTLPTLAKICRVYGVDLGHFFCDVTHHSVSITRNAHLLDNRREQPTAKQIPLHHSDRRSGQTAKVIDLPSGATLNVTAADGNTTFTAYVLEGTLRMIAAGVEDIFRAGDCVVLDSDTTVLWIADGSRCRVLTVSPK